MMRVRITQIDGALPNLALMHLANFHKSRGDEVVVTRHLKRDLFEQDYDRVYGSVLFSFSAARLQRFLAQWPDAIVGGTGAANGATVEQITGGTYDACDYSGYPDFDASIGPSGAAAGGFLSSRSRKPDGRGKSCAGAAPRSRWAAGRVSRANT